MFFANERLAKIGETRMLRDVILHGALGERFGERFRFNVASARQAARALIVLKPGFREHLNDGHYRVLVGDERRAFGLDEGSLAMKLGSLPEIHFVPEITGAGGAPSRGASTGKAIAGAALVALAVATVVAGPEGAGLSATFMGVQASTIGAIGLGLALSGISGLLAKAPGQSSESFVFGGQDNVTTQGGCVPIVVGSFMCGGVIISAGLQAYDLVVGSSSALPFNPAVSPNQSYYSTDA
jgi:predicted phage tail protein